MPGPRLVTVADAVLAVEGRSAHARFGPPENRKRRSCDTLFATVSPPGPALHRLRPTCIAG